MAVADLVKPAGTGDETIVWTNGTGASVTAHTPQVIEEPASNLKGLACIPLVTVANGSTGAAYVKGQFRIAKDTSVALAQGETAWYDVSESKATNAATATTDGDFVLGVTAEAAATAATGVVVALNAGADAYTVYS